MRVIGHFEVLEKLGAGGMGEVFKARDTRLNRFVALKFLPESATTDARERFQREALAIAALSHPNICALYEIGDDQGRPFLVLELLEGESLRARLAKGPVPAAQLLDWGAQIAEALDAAHKRGVLHRDLKPDNIFVLPGGHIKVLDFGLARLETEAQSSGSNDRTLTSPGVTLGTVPYMSPEQAKGEPLDARSDIFSFGSVFYEMASGRQAFPPRSAAETIAAILKDQPPPIRKARPELAPKLEEIALRCLEKDPELRYQSAADLRSELRRLSRIGASRAADDPAPFSSAVAAASPASSSAAAPLSDSQIVSGLLRRHWRWPVLAALVLAAVAVWLLLRRPAAHPEPAALASVQLQLRQLTDTGRVRDAAISRDGKFLAHVDASPQGTSLRLMAISNGSDTQIMPPSPQCCVAPAFSPDGSSIYFNENMKLMSVPVLGGEVRTVADHVCAGAGFSPDGRRIAYLAPANGSDELVIAQADGTQPHVLNHPNPLGFNSPHCWFDGLIQPDAPAWSPDGRWIAVDESSNTRAALSDHIALVSAADGRLRPLGSGMPVGASGLAWLPDGNGLIFTNSIPPAAPPQLFELTYPGGKLLQLTHDLQGFEHPSVASQMGGEIVMEHRDPRFSVWAQTAPGGAFAELDGGGADQDGAAGLAWTSQGRLIAVRDIAGKEQLWLEGGNAPAHQIPINALPPMVGHPISLPNGQLVFNAVAGETSFRWNLFRVNADGTGLTDLTPGLNSFRPSLVLHGKAIVFLGVYTSANQVHQGLFAVSLVGGAPREISKREFIANIVLPMPDQHHVLALAAAPGRGAGTVVEVSADGATITPEKPRVNIASLFHPYGVTPDGRALTGVINAGDVGNIWAVPLNGAPLYEITHFTSQSIAAYAFGPGGRLAVSRGSQNSDAVLATGLVKKPH